MNKRNLNDRLIDFAVRIITITNGLENSKAANHLAGQLVRSGTSPALNYGEAQSGESRKDFIHKLQIVLKELRETMNALKIISRANLYRQEDLLNETITENNELIAIFVTSVETAKRNEKNNDNNKK